jgi:hypothetical protein
MKQKLFTPIVDTARLSLDYIAVLQDAGYEPARILLEEIWEKYETIDGNFLEQFQTTGFSQRLFEIALAQWLSEEGFTFDFSHDRPDFIVSKNNVIVCIEATTANATAGQSTSLPPEERAKWFEDEAKLRAAISDLEDAFIVKLGSALYSKMQHQYWNLDWVRNKPFVIALEPFHHDLAQSISEHRLLNYLYGYEYFPIFNDHGGFEIGQRPLQTHQYGSKTIPSGFFSLPNSEHVSAVIFSNSATIAKFNRLGYQINPASYPKLEIIRFGVRYNPDPNATQPLPFVFQLSKEGHREVWGEGISVFFNPNARHPIHPELFGDNVMKLYSENGSARHNIPVFHPYSSLTYCFKIVS